MKDTPLSGPWANALAEEIVKRGIELALGPDGLIARYMEPYPFTAQPVTLSSLLSLPPEQVGQKLAGLIRDPATQAEGVALMRKYVESMSKRMAPVPSSQFPIGEAPNATV